MKGKWLWAGGVQGVYFLIGLFYFSDGYLFHSLTFPIYFLSGIVLMPIVALLPFFLSIQGGILKRLKYTFTLSALFVLIFTGLSYFKVEISSRLYARQFVKVSREENEIGTIEYIKVFNFSFWEATVFMVEKFKNNKSGSFRVGIFYHFLKDDASGSWKLSSYETVWNDAGSAAGITWPPYF